jgi:hypothetical protein
MALAVREANLTWLRMMSSCSLSMASPLWHEDVDMDEDVHCL